MDQTFALSLFLFLPPFFILLLSIKRAKSSKLKLPPSPPKLPFIGNLHLLGSVPHRSLRSLSNKHGPLMLLQLGQVQTLVISSPDLARDVMKTHDLIFASRPPSKIARLILRGSNDIAFAPYGEYWRQARKLCVTHLLSSKMVQSFQRVREEEVELMIAKIYQVCSSVSVVNMSEVLISFASSVISRVVSFEFFREEERKRTLCKLATENGELLGGFYVGEFFPQIGWALDIFRMDVSSRAKRTSEKWNKILDEVIRDNANRSQNDTADKNIDFIDILLSLERELSSIHFPFTRDNIKAILIDMFAAGIDTSYIVLEWSMAELIRNPKVMKKLQSEVRGAATSKDRVREDDLSKMSYIKAVIKEVMRLHPPVPLLLPRESIENCQLAGYRVPKGTRVLVNAWAIGRDPNFWEEPDEFKPERFESSNVDYKGSDFQFIPFGAGRRICPGMSLAVQNMELALANLVHRFDWEMPGNMSRDELDMNDTSGLTSHKKERLDLAAQLFSQQ